MFIKGSFRASSFGWYPDGRQTPNSLGERARRRFSTERDSALGRAGAALARAGPYNPYMESRDFVVVCPRTEDYGGNGLGRDFERARSPHCASAWPKRVFGVCGGIHIRFELTKRFLRFCVFLQNLDRFLKTPLA